MQLLFESGFTGDPPGWRWDFFRRLEQSATVEAVPVVVESLAAAVPAPGEQTLRNFFEQYKDDLPESRSATPGFREPHRAKYQYLVAKREAFEGEAAKQVTDEQIAEYYEKNKTSQFRAKPADDAKPEEPSAEKPAAEKPADDATNFEPLEKVKDDIRTRLAREAADKRVDAIFSAVATDMGSYAEAYALWQARGKASGAQPPEPPDFDKIAATQGLEAGRSDLVTADQAVAAGPLGGSFEFVPDATSRFGIRQQRWLDMIYGQSAPTLRPVTSRDVEGNRYVSWKIEDQPEFTPTFQAAREGVERAWRIVEARSLARKKAEEIAAKVEAGGPLADAVIGMEGLAAAKAGPFTWLTQGTAPFGTPPSLSQPEGISMPGEEFMQAVFALEPGRTAVAFNEPRTVCYVVRLESLEPPQEKLRQQFLEARDDQRRLAMVAQRETARAEAAWVESLENRHAVTWHREPR
jgi:hypothetical protein